MCSARSQWLVSVSMPALAVRLVPLHLLRRLACGGCVQGGPRAQGLAGTYPLVFYYYLRARRDSQVGTAGAVVEY